MSCICRGYYSTSYGYGHDGFVQICNSEYEWQYYTSDITCQYIIYELLWESVKSLNDPPKNCY